jgi:uncharacterized protein (DUF1697 family)
MPSYAAFLRGMNLGGRRISNIELCKAFAGLGFADVHAFRASGNVVFSAPEAPTGTLTERIEHGLQEALGYAVPTFLRSAEEVRAIASQQPFDAKAVDASSGKLQVDVLLEAPPAAARKAVLVLATDDDRLAFGERELYWLPVAGTLESALDQAAIAALLGPSTRRTKNTIEQIAGKYFGG